MKNTLKQVGIFLVCLSFIFLWQTFRKSKIDTFGIGRPVKKSERSSRFISRYVFGTHGVFYNYKGKDTRYKRHKNFKLNATYLVAFTRRTPINSYIFYDYPISDTFNIDSLNKCCDPKDFFEKGSR
ncbi:MAG: hypothetical protein AAGG68_18250 [Bacteroidota bacterium]